MVTWEENIINLIRLAEKDIKVTEKETASVKACGRDSVWCEALIKEAAGPYPPWKPTCLVSELLYIQYFETTAYIRRLRFQKMII